jgi:hypothetical protein
VLNKAEVLAEIKSLHQQLAERTNKLPDQQAFHVQVEKAFTVLCFSCKLEVNSAVPLSVVR